MSVDSGVFLEITDDEIVDGVETDDGAFLELSVDAEPTVVELEVAEFLEFDDGRGPTGPRGPAGGETVRYTQPTPAATWPINHDMGKYPNIIFLLDSSPGEPVVTDYVYTDENNILVEWPSPESGIAELS